MNAETDTRPKVSPTRLWFGFAGSAASWIALGLVDIVITWRVCLDRDQSGVSHAQPSLRIAYFVVTALLFLTAIAAGAISYRNWRDLSDSRSISRSESRGRGEYMAFAGVFISFTLGVGIILLGLPAAILNLCVRAH
ncbi:MAG TPA: hypothetical protein VH088_03360 [Terriglobales bacterium]|jgi:hypothetical protein|nr:hypothetical protein [Terriglobales bacterium]